MSSPPVASSDALSLKRSAPLQQADESANDISSLNKSKKNSVEDTAVASEVAIMGYGTVLAREKTFSGRVINVKNQPVRDLIVSAVTSKQPLVVQTDSNGYFKFRAVDSVALVVLKKDGFETVHIRIQGDANADVITFKERNDNVDKSLVAMNQGVGSQAPRVKSSGIQIQQAEPLIGFPLYNDYLLKNKRLPFDSAEVHGEVIISFIVREDGTLSDYKIEKSLSKRADNEALRLIKEGPAWKATKGIRSMATVSIKF